MTDRIFAFTNKKFNRNGTKVVSTAFVRFILSLYKMLLHKKNSFIYPGRACIIYHPCPDGSNKRACILLSLNENGEQSYSCNCPENKKPQLSSVNYVWSPWYTLTDSRVGFYREIKDMLTTGTPALAIEYK